MKTQWPAAVARAMHELDDATPPAPAFTDLDRQRVGAPPQRRAGSMMAVAAALVLVAATVAILALVRRGDHSSANATVPNVDVHHSRVEISMSADLSCDQPMDNTAKFTTFTADTYSDRIGRQWLTRITYPDGSTHEQLHFGSPIYPTRAYQRGVTKDATLGCTYPSGERDVMAFSLAETGMMFLTIADELANDELPYVIAFKSFANQVPGEHLDGNGRPAQLWERRNDGMYGRGNVDPTIPMTHSDSYWVDPADGTTVLQRRMVQTITGVGTGTSAAILIDGETELVPQTIFDPSGYEPMQTWPRPDLDEESGGTVASSSVAPTASP